MQSRGEGVFVEIFDAAVTGNENGSGSEARRVLTYPQGLPLSDKAEEDLEATAGSGNGADKAMRAPLGPGDTWRLAASRQPRRT